MEGWKNPLPLMASWSQRIVPRTVTPRLLPCEENEPLVFGLSLSGAAEFNPKQGPSLGGRSAQSKFNFTGWKEREVLMWVRRLLKAASLQRYRVFMTL